MAKGSGTPEDPWVLQTPSGQSEFEMHRDPGADPPAVVCRVRKTGCGITSGRSRTCTRC